MFFGKSKAAIGCHWVALVVPNQGRGAARGIVRPFDASCGCAAPVEATGATRRTGGPPAPARRGTQLFRHRALNPTELGRVLRAWTKWHLPLASAQSIASQRDAGTG